MDAGLGVRNGLFGASVLAGAKGLRDVVAGILRGDEVTVDTKGFAGAGEGDLLGLPSLSAARGSANRTCLLLKVPRCVPLPFTAVPFCPRCSRFAAFSSRSSSKGLGEFSVVEVPEDLKLEQ